MRRNSIVFSLIAALLLTGCSGGEQLWKQAQDPDYTFVDSKEEVQDILVKERSKPSNVVFSKEMAEELQKLEEALKEPLAKGLISVDSEAYETDDEDVKYEEYEEYEEEPTETISNFNREYRKGKFSEKNVFEDYVAVSEKNLREAFILLEKSGYVGLCDLIDNYNTDGTEDRTKIICGIRFFIYYDEEWNLGIRVNKDQLCRTKTMDHFMKENIDVCFTMDESISGGYIERIKLIGGQGLPDEDFSINFVIDTREGKAIRLYAGIQANKRQISGGVFTEEQQPTVIRLLTQITGNEKESEEFVKNLQLKTDAKGNPEGSMKVGKIGDKTYQLQSESLYYNTYYDEDFARFILSVG